MTTILITSIASLAGLGIVGCVENNRASLRIVGTNSVAKAAGNFLADKAYLVPETADAEAYRAAIERILKDENPAVVLNGRDEELGVLGSLRDGGAFPSTHFLVPPAALVPVFNDKYETGKFARDHDLPFADTAYLPEEVERLLARYGFPLIAKPRWGGHASKSVFLIYEGRQVEAALETGHYVLQQVLWSPSLKKAAPEWKPQLGIPWAWSVRDERHQANAVLGRDGEIVALWMAAGVSEGALLRELHFVDEPSIRRTVGLPLKLECPAPSHKERCRFSAAPLPSLSASSSSVRHWWTEAAPRQTYQLSASLKRLNVPDCTGVLMAARTRRAATAADIEMPA